MPDRHNSVVPANEVGGGGFPFFSLTDLTAEPDKMANVEAIRAWVEDLRSGRFKQGKNVLRHGDRYCCMGVACETHKRLSGVPYEWERNKEDGVGDLVYAREDQTLPVPVADWLGVASADPELDTGEAFSASDSCSMLNDVLGWTFAQIADAIERTYLSEPATVTEET